MLSRRAALKGGTATMAAIAVTGAAVARIAVDDPVFVALDELKRHTAIWYAIDEGLEKRRYKAHEERYGELWDRLLETHAQTLPGAVAKFRYFSDELNGDLDMDLAESLVSDFERLVGRAAS